MRAIAPHQLTEAQAVFRATWIKTVRKWQEDKDKRQGASSYKPGPRWDGGKDSRTQRRYGKPIWPNLLDAAARLGVDPQAAIVCLFSWWPTDDIPPPTAVVGAENLMRLEDRRRRLDNEVRILFTSESQLFRARLNAALVSFPDRNKARQSVLVNPAIELSPLFRFAAGVMYELPEVCEKYKIAAMEQYGRGPKLYQQYWAPILTPEVMKALLA